jgi:HK97 family phage major capsid protein
VATERKYYSMKARGPKAAEVLIYEQIGSGFWSEGLGAKQFAKDLKELGDIDDLTIRINSEGGSVFEGQAIYSQLKNHKAKKTVYIDGLAASIASVIAMAGDTIIMPENATMMIHDPWTLAMGNADDMRKSAEALDTIKLGIIAAYRNKSGLDDAEISELMTEETWMTGPIALEKGFCDECEKPRKLAAAIRSPEILAMFRNVPQNLLDKTGLDIDTAARQRVSEQKAINQLKEDKTMPKVPCSKCGSPMDDTGDCPACEQKIQTQNAVTQARKDEATRAKAVRAVAREYKMDSIGEIAVVEGWSEDQTKDAILKKIKAGTAPGEPLNISITPNHEGKPFRSLGEQLVAVANAARGRMDNRLMEVFNAPAGASESVTSDGGFLVQSDFTTSLLQLTHETEVLAPRCRHIPVTGNGIDAPVVDETTRATGSRFGGVQVYRTAEAGTVTAKKPKFAMWSMKLQKLMGVFYSTDELLEDASALSAIASTAFSEEMGFKVDDEIVNGSGTGEMLGILNAPALVSVTKETGQTAATIVAENIIKMYSRMPARSKPNAVWLINSECMPQIMMLNLVLGTAAVPLYFPPGGLSAAPYGTIFGRPVIEIEQAAALGTVGDIMFVDLNQYGIIEKGGINAQQSIHVQFLTDETTFRWTMRNNGMPIWRNYLTPYKGSATVSPYVALATRA